MPSAGQLIYSGFEPLIKTGLTIIVGYIITKKGLFPTLAARGASHIAMSIALPCLIFSSIVTSFSAQNISALGPLFLNAVIYQLMGTLLGLIIREIFRVPADFRHGIVIACAFSNWGNLPVAVVQTVAKNEPFDPSTDPTLGVAYVSVFILIYNISFFGLGTCKICAWDFAEGVQDDDVSRSEVWRRRWARMTGGRRNARAHRKQQEHKFTISEASDGDDKFAAEGEDVERSASDAHQPPLYTGASSAAPVMAPTLSRFRSHQSAIADAQLYHDTISLAPVSSRTSRANATGQGSSTSNNGVGRAPSQRRDTTTAAAAAAGWHDHEEEEEHALGSDGGYDRDRKGDAMVDTDGQPNPHEQAVPPLPAPMGEESKGEKHNTTVEKSPPLSTKSRVAQAVLPILKTLATPATLSVIFAIPVSLVSPLKALFTHVDGWTGGKMPNAPDGNPPLSFLLDTCQFIGALCVPLGLMLLGASFARLELPRPWSRLPLAAIVAVTTSKLVIMPCFGVGLTLGLRNTTSLYPTSNKILSFVAMLLSGTPSAVNQLVITQLYSPTGTANTLAAFLALQYVAMFVLSAALAAVALAIVS